MRKKVHSYLGFAKKSGNLISGYNTCTFAMAKRKVKLLIIAEDLTENSMKKILKEAEKHHVPFKIFGVSDELSQITGCTGRGIFAITDQKFADIIVKEIGESQSQEKEVFE